MTTGTKWLLGLTAAGIVTGIAYRNGVDKLQFDIDGFEFRQNGTLIIRIRVTNYNRFFGYPVPKMTVNAFDDNGNYIGTIINQQMQYISAYGISYIYGLVSPDYGTLISLLVSVITEGGYPEGISFAGGIEVGPVIIPINTNVAIGGRRNYDYACPMIYDRVRGEDGIVYGNPCLAEKAGNTIYYREIIF